MAFFLSIFSDGDQNVKLLDVQLFWILCLRAGSVKMQIVCILVNIDPTNCGILFFSSEMYLQISNWLIANVDNC